MKALILAAGYATRLYPLTKDRPKPLLPVAGRPMMDYVVERIMEADEIDRIYVVTNHKFAGRFEAWQREAPLPIPVAIIDDNTVSDEDKLGAIGDIRFVIERENIKDELLVVAGDNLFDFKIRGLIEFFKNKNCRPAIALYDVSDMEQVKKYSVVRLDTNERVISFEEKPQNPKTSLISICLYIFPGDIRNKIKEYIGKRLNPDAPGYFVSWLSQEEPVYGYRVTSGRWYDIGGFDVYYKADKEYSQLKGCAKASGA